MIRKRDLIVYSAAAWAFIFGIFHFIWAMGWYVGLNAKEAEKAFAKPLFYGFDLLIAAMCAIAVAIALVFARPWEKRKPHKFVSALAWTGTILLVLRSTASIVQTVYLLVTKQFSSDLRALGWEVWFYCGAILWGLTVWYFAPRQGVWKIVAVLLLLFLSLYLFLALFVGPS
jgi:Protein of unknown function (DUF3995)